MKIQMCWQDMLIQVYYMKRNCCKERNESINYKTPEYIEDQTSYKNHQILSYLEK